MLGYTTPAVPVALFPGVLGWIATVIVALAIIGALTWRLWQEQRQSAIDLDEHERLLAEEQEKASQARLEKDALARENQGKSEMVATLSREVRAHLNGIMGSADLLLDGALTLTQREHLSTLRASAESLHQSLNDILDYSIIEAGKLRIESAPFVLRDPLIEVVEHLSPLAALKGLELALIASPNVPRYVSGDSTRIRQILLNLMSNSVRFTASGRVIMRVSVPPGSTATSAQGATWVHFSVTDTGTGIPEEMQATIFDRFAQSDSPSPRKIGGSGLDLAISKRLVELMGGKIGVRGLPESGVEFWVVLPLVADPKEMPVTPPPMIGVHAVVLDDLAASRVAISGLLTQLGTEHDAADNVAEAADLLRDAHEAGATDLALLLDESVAHDNADDLGRLLADSAVNQATRIILMTRDPEWAAAAAHPFPVAAILRKPVLRTELLLRALTSPRPPPSRGSAGTAKPKGPARKTPHVLVVDDDEISRSVTAQLLERLGCTVDRVISGADAIERTRKNKYSLVFMDCQMPEMDGFTATMKIIAENPNDAPPIVALTASTTAKDREKCFASGMCDFVDKPARKAELDRVLQRWTAADPTASA